MVVDKYFPFLHDSKIITTYTVDEFDLKSPRYFVLGSELDVVDDALLNRLITDFKLDSGDVAVRMYRIMPNDIYVLGNNDILVNSVLRSSSRPSTIKAVVTELDYGRVAANIEVENERASIMRITGTESVEVTTDQFVMDASLDQVSTDITNITEGLRRRVTLEDYMLYESIDMKEGLFDKIRTGNVSSDSPIEPPFYEMIRTYLKSTTPTKKIPMLVGMSGVAKSAIVKSVADELGLRMVDLRVAFMSRLEIDGLAEVLGKETGNPFTMNAPMTEFLVCTDQYLEFSRNVVKLLDGKIDEAVKVDDVEREMYLRALHAKFTESSKTPVLFFDEITRSDSSIRGALTTIINQRIYNNYTLNEARMIAATNAPVGYEDDDDMQGFFIGAALDDVAVLDRFNRIPLTPTDVYPTWIKYVEKNFHPLVYKYVRDNPDKSYDMTDAVNKAHDYDREDELIPPYPTFRAWENISNYLDSIESSLRYNTQIIDGLLGSSNSPLFIEYLNENGYSNKYTVDSGDDDVDVRLVRVVRYGDSIKDTVMKEFTEEAIEKLSELLGNTYQPHKDLVIGTIIRLRDSFRSSSIPEDVLTKLFDPDKSLVAESIPYFDSANIATQLSNESDRLINLYQSSQDQSKADDIRYYALFGQSEVVQRSIKSIVATLLDRVHQSLKSSDFSIDYVESREVDRDEFYRSVRAEPVLILDGVPLTLTSMYDAISSVEDYPEHQLNLAIRVILHALKEGGQEVQSKVLDTSNKRNYSKIVNYLRLSQDRYDSVARAILSAAYELVKSGEEFDGMSLKEFEYNFTAQGSIKLSPTRQFYKANIYEVVRIIGEWTNTARKRGTTGVELGAGFDPNSYKIISNSALSKDADDSVKAIASVVVDRLVKEYYMTNPTVEEVKGFSVTYIPEANIDSAIDQTIQASRGMDVSHLQANVPALVYGTLAAAVKSAIGVYTPPPAAAEGTEYADPMSDFIEDSLDAGLPTMLIGASGLGKTTRIQEYCEKNNYNFELVSLASKERMDIMGIPAMVDIIHYISQDSEGILDRLDIVDELQELKFKAGLPNSVTVRSPKSELISRIEEAKRTGRPIVLFFDEFNRSPDPTTQSAIFQAISDNNFAGVEFPPGLVKVALAGNMGESTNEAGGIDAALTARAVQYKKLSYDIEDARAVLGYMKKKGYAKALLDFIGDDLDMVLNMIKSVDEGSLTSNVSSTRSLEALSNSLLETTDSKIMHGTLLCSDRTLVQEFYMTARSDEYALNRMRGIIDKNINKWALRDTAEYDKGVPMEEAIAVYKEASAKYEQGDRSDELVEGLHEVMSRMLQLDSHVTEFREKTFSYYVDPELASKFTEFYNSYLDIGELVTIEDLVIDPISDIPRYIKSEFIKLRVYAPDWSDLVIRIYNHHGAALSDDDYKLAILTCIELDSSVENSRKEATDLMSDSVFGKVFESIDKADSSHEIAEKLNFDKWRIQTAYSEGTGKVRTTTGVIGGGLD